MIIAEATDEDLQWAADIFEVEALRPDAEGLVVKIGEERQAVVVYEAFSSHDCHMHIASNGQRKWLSRKLLLIAFYLPFEAWSLNRVTSPVEMRNQDSIRLVTKLGFKQEGVMEDWFADDHAIIFGMTRKQCPYLAWIGRYTK